MEIYPKKQFLGIEPAYTDFAKARVAILPFPYEGGISYGAGTAGAPDAVIDASYYLELYDETLQCEPYRIGITTLPPPHIPSIPEEMDRLIEETVSRLLAEDKFIVVIGGDHSITGGAYRAFHKKWGEVSVIQLDAHADLRETYEGTPLSHACVMARIREHTTQTLQLGIRSCSAEEAKRIRDEGIWVYTMDQIRGGEFSLGEVISRIPDPVYVTIDVDVFDWSFVRSTGTPEPGGFTWDESIRLLRMIFEKKTVLGFDVVELSAREDDPNSPFAVAKLIYKLIGFRFWKEIASLP